MNYLQKKLEDLLIELDRVAFEQWRSHGVKLKAVSANADGIVNSGITSTGVYFYRKWEMPGFKSSKLVVER